MKKLILVAVAVAAAVSFGAVDKSKRIRYPGGAAERMLHINGERIEKPGTGKGRIVFVEATDRIGGDFLAKWTRTLSTEQSLHMDVVKGAPVTVANAAAEAKKLDAAAVVFVLEDESLPLSLVAYEGKWAIVNVKPLFEGIPVPIARKRVHKLVFRTYANLCGAAEGIFGGSIMSPVAKAEDLDGVKIDDPLPMPLLGAIGTHMVKAGMEATTTACYRQACEEGWAPKPSNDIEREIWERVHKLPTDPLVIKHKKNSETK